MQSLIIFVIVVVYILVGIVSAAIIQRITTTDWNRDYEDTILAILVTFFWPVLIAICIVYWLLWPVRKLFVFIRDL